MIAAVELLSKPSIPTRDVAWLIGYSQPPHFRTDVPPTLRRLTLGLGPR
jgi:hypothetical protein